MPNDSTMDAAADAIWKHEEAHRREERDRRSHFLLPLAGRYAAEPQVVAEVFVALAMVCAANEEEATPDVIADVLSRDLLGRAATEEDVNAILGPAVGAEILTLEVKSNGDDDGPATEFWSEYRIAPDDIRSMLRVGARAWLDSTIVASGSP